MAADLTQTSEGGEHVNLALAESFFRDGFHHLLAAPAEFRQVKLALFIAELAIAALLDSFRQILRDMPFQTPEEQRTKFGREAAAGDALRRVSIFSSRFVRFRELLLIAKIARLDKIH